MGTIVNRYTSFALTENDIYRRPIPETEGVAASLPALIRVIPPDVIVIGETANYRLRKGVVAIKRTVAGHYSTELIKIQRILRGSASSDHAWNTDPWRIRTFCYAGLTNGVMLSAQTTVIRNHTTGQGLFFDTSETTRIIWPTPRITVPLIVEYDEYNKYYKMKPTGPITFPDTSVINELPTPGVALFSPNLVRYHSTALYWRAGVVFHSEIDKRMLISSPNFGLEVHVQDLTVIRNENNWIDYLFYGFAIAKLLARLPDNLYNPEQNYTGWLTNDIRAVPLLFPGEGGDDGRLYYMLNHDERHPLSFFSQFESNISKPVINRTASGVTYSGDASENWPIGTWQYNSVLIYDADEQIPLFLRTFTRRSITTADTFNVSPLECDFTTR